MTVDIRIPRTQLTNNERASTHQTFECSCYRANLNVELMPDTHTPETYLLAARQMTSLRRALEQLPLLEQYVLVMGWGIGLDRPVKFSEICLTIGGTERGARRIFSNGMRRLRKKMKEEDE